MKKATKILSVTLLARIGIYSCNIAGSDNETATGDSLSRTQSNTAAMDDKDGIPDVSYMAQHGV